MGMKERLLREILTEGIARCQKELDIAGIQRKYNAYEQRIVRMQVLDVAVAPTYLRVRDGRIEEVLNPPKVDCEMTFVYLDSFLDVILGKYKIEQVFAFSGFRPVNKSLIPFSQKFGIRAKWERVCYYRGDVGRDSFFLREVLREYLVVLRKILMEMPAMRYIIGPAAKVKRIFYTDKDFSITASQGDGFSSVQGDSAPRTVVARPDKDGG